MSPVISILLYDFRTILCFFFLILQEPIAAPLSSHQGGSSVSTKSMGSNGLSNDCESLSNQGPWYSSSAKLALHRPKRFVIPSKFKMSPYMMPHSKITVSRLEADVYGVVLNMAESEHSE